MLYQLCDLELWLWPWILKVKFLKSSNIAIWGWIDMEPKGWESIGCWTQVATLNFWPHLWPWPWIFKVKFLIAIFYEWEGRLTWNQRDVSWLQCWIHNGLVLGPQCMAKNPPSNGSMWNSYSFQPVGPWMGYSFTDLGAEGCCRSLNVLFTMFPSYHHEIFRSYYQWQKWGPCKRSRSEVKGQGHRGQNPT